MIFFQAMKHHVASVAARVHAALSEGAAGRGGLLEAILPLGAAGVVDVYEGGLSPAEIVVEIAAWLETKAIADRDSFRLYLESEGAIRRIGHYLVVDLSDTSRFCLRASDEGEAFVHAHPARYSPHTFRIRPQTLKTAILAQYLARRDGRDPSDLAVLDEARSWIGLSPLGEVPEGIREAVGRLGAVLQGSNSAS